MQGYFVTAFVIPTSATIYTYPIPQPYNLKIVYHNWIYLIGIDEVRTSGMQTM